MHMEAGMNNISESKYGLTIFAYVKSNAGMSRFVLGVYQGSVSVLEDDKRTALFLCRWATLGMLIIIFVCFVVGFENSSLMSSRGMKLKVLHF